MSFNNVRASISDQPLHTHKKRKHLSEQLNVPQPGHKYRILSLYAENVIRLLTKYAP